MAEEEDDKAEGRKKEKVKDTIELAASQLGYDRWEDRNKNSAIPECFGMCSSCQNMQFATTEFRVRWAQCEVFGYGLTALQLSMAEPVQECTNYKKNGQLSLRDMVNIATLIDVNKKQKVGF